MLGDAAEEDIAKGGEELWGKSVNDLGPPSRHEFTSREVPRNHADFIWSVADLLRGVFGCEGALRAVLGMAR